jgi:hypothetical protein
MTPAVEHWTSRTARENFEKAAQEKILCELLAYISPDSHAGCVIKEKLAELRKGGEQG